MWSIPAYAGEPRHPAHQSRRPRVYPRVCGGTNFQAADKLNQQGLSPRMRGNLCFRVQQPDAVWSIPAYAGEPWGCSYSASVSRVYPRVCGGTGYGGGNPVRRGGLSPRMRGNQRSLYPPGVEKRSIPAYAGEPPRLLKTGRPRAVYPRVCGGTRTAESVENGPEGLSPRMRGNPPASIAIPTGTWSIPAYAGEPA